MTPFAQGSLLRAARAAPAVDIDRLAAGGVLVLAPHPDDETVGCGASIAAAVEAGHAVHVVVVTDGGGSHPGSLAWPRTRVATRRAQELAAALDVLGSDRITHECLGCPDQGTPAPDEPTGIDVLACLLDILRTRRPAHLWTTWEGDPHIDHERCATLADALLASADAEGIRPVEWRFAVWGRFVEREFDAGALRRFVPDSSMRLAKARALACHATQMTHLIDDDPDGFVMPGPMQAHFVEHDELFVCRSAA